jgi:valyl-tRNA synthetase
MNRDNQGRNRSKSLDNGIDPLELTAKYGTAALRWMLATHAEPGLDMRFNPAQLSAEAKFINKIWQAARFFDLCPILPAGAWGHTTEEQELDALTRQWDEGLLNGRFAGTARHLQSHFRDWFCSGWIERNKTACQDGNPATLALGLRLLQRYLSLLHPFLPFLTSELDKQIGQGRWE